MQIIQLVNEGLVGGVFRVAVEQTVHLNGFGHKTILHSGFMPYTYEGFLSPNIHVYNKITNFPSPSPFTNYINPLLKEIAGVFFKPKIPYSFQADWIICHNLGPFYDALKLKKIMGSRVAVMIHNPTFLPPLRPFTRISKLGSLLREKEHSLLKNCDIIIATSVHTKKLIRRLYSLDSEILYPGFDPIPNLPQTRGDFILCASRLSLGKKVHEIAKAVSLIDKRAKVIFAGGIHRTTHLAIRKIRKMKLWDYKIIPNVDEKTLLKLYTRCRVYVSVIAEPFGLPQIEAASHGAPMVCNAASGASELFESGKHGYFIDDINGYPPIHEYAKSLAELMLDERKAWNMGYRAWHLVLKKYTWKHHVQRLIRLLENS